MSCACDRDYDSVTGTMNDYVCDWCQEEEENRCCCEYGYERNYRYLEWECESCYRKRPTQTDPWVTEKATISGHLSTFSFCETIEERVEALRPLFEYLLTIGPFFKAFPRFYAACVAKVTEFKADPLAEPIAALLEDTERFLASIV